MKTGLYLGETPIGKVIVTSAGSGGINLQEKEITPSTSQQIIKPDNGYDGLSQVTINAISPVTQAKPSIDINPSGLITATSTQSTGYVFGGTEKATKQLATKDATEWTPSIDNQTISSGTYLTGTQVIKGDSNLIANNIKNGINIFGVDGVYNGSINNFISTITFTSSNLDNYNNIVIDCPDNFTSFMIFPYEGFYDTSIGGTFYPDGLYCAYSAINWLQKGVEGFSIFIDGKYTQNLTGYPYIRFFRDQSTGNGAGALFYAIINNNKLILTKQISVNGTFSTNILLQDGITYKAIFQMAT